MRAPRPVDLIAAALAACGVALAVDAWHSGSLRRYQLAGYVAGTLLCLPLLAILTLRERARRICRKLAFAAVPLAGALLLAEFAWRLFGPAATPPARVQLDARLGHVLEPGSAGTDARGFRNASVPDRIDALLVGDSQTWGFGVAARDTFAAQFATATGITTYQMADGSYGPVQYRELVRRGLALRPRMVVVAFYFGNDFVDAVDYAALEGAEDLRAPGIGYELRRETELDGPFAPNWTMALVDRVLGASRLLDAAAGVVKARLRGGMLDTEVGAVPFADDHVPTILRAAYRLPTVDLRGPRMQDALRITRRCLADISADCHAAGARCVLLAIPTKVYCYALWRQQVGEPIAALHELLRAEGDAREQLFAATHADGLELIDLGPPCVAALAEGTPIWGPTGDGHLAPPGHLLAARLLAGIWRK